MTKKLAFALAAGVASLALVGAGCGGDDEASSESSDTTEWAHDFCTAVSAWTDELQQIGDDIDDPSSFNVDALEQAAEDVNASTDEFVEDVRALGAPDTESGEEVQASLESLADTLEQERNDIEDAVSDTSGLTDVAAAITAIGTSLAAMGTAFQQALEAIESADVSGELETAFEGSAACDEITS